MDGMLDGSSLFHAMKTISESRGRVFFTGLSTDEAQERLEKEDYNELFTARRRSTLIIAIGVSRVRYDLEEISHPDLADAVANFLRSKLLRP
jgi:hypothetical protein